MEPYYVSLLGYRSADGYGSIRLGNSVLLSLASDQDPDFVLGLQSVRFILSYPTGLPPPLDRKHISLKDVENPVPRTLLVPEAVLVVENDLALNYILRPGFDPRKEVVLSNAPLDVLTHGAEWTEDFMGRTEVSVDTSSEIRLKVEASAPAYLLLTDTWYPGWRATVDENEVPIYRANLSFRALAVPAGHHQIVFRYQPESLRGGIQITVLSLVLVAWLAIRGSGWLRNTST
jgi:hypothetical protein